MTHDERMLMVKMIDALTSAYDRLDETHARCNIDSDDDHDCYAEQYGDGNEYEHAEMRDLAALVQTARKAVMVTV